MARLSFKDAAKRMVATQDLKLYFFFCEADADGKPVMLADTSKIDLKKDKEILGVLASAKSKGHIGGSMTLRDTELSLTPRGTAVNAKKLEIGVQRASKEHGITSLVGSVVVGTPDTEEDALPQPTTLRAKEKGSEFADEDKTRSFRSSDPADRLKTDFVTEYAADPSASRAEVEAGLLRDGQGGLVGGKKGFVVDPGTGAVHLFDQKVEVENVRTGQRRPALQGDLPPAKLQPDERLVATHHTTPLAGGAVAGAGELEVKQGVVTRISDQSGHYKPEGDLTLQSVQALKNQGAKLVGDTLVAGDTLDSGGRALSEEEQQDYAKLIAYRQRLGLEPDRSLGDQLKHMVAEGKKDEELIEMAKLELKLRKAGVGPSRTQAVVELGGKGVTEEEFNEVKGDRDKVNALMLRKYGVPEALWEGVPANVLSNHLELNNMLRKQIPKVKLGAETFLQTGGEEKTIRQKQELGKSVADLITPELWETIKGDRERINEELRKRIGRADFLPKSIAEETLNNLVLINLLVAKGTAALARGASGQPGTGPGKPEHQTAVDALVEKLGIKFEGEADKGMPPDYGAYAIEDVEDTATKLGISAGSLQAWLNQDRVTNLEELADEVGLSLAGVYEKLTGKKA